MDPEKTAENVDPEKSDENFVFEKPKSLENMMNQQRNRQCHLAFPH